MAQQFEYLRVGSRNFHTAAFLVKFWCEQRKRFFVGKTTLDGYNVYPTEIVKTLKKDKPYTEGSLAPTAPNQAEYITSILSDEEFALNYWNSYAKDSNFGISTECPFKGTPKKKHLNWESYFEVYCKRAQSVSVKPVETPESKKAAMKVAGCARRKAGF